ncbi:MAG: Transcriptional regulator of heat shock protein [Candidatus Moranbacteria bacterium GW2011_GWE2_35_2-]|nr:MAG: Transcriptional regulator of heat shock protein [Candidatus Moranbacteria bacterium GW2011_GWE2_35_2-]KKQ22943.1 MAG: Transcriptional regulator of heat shock protein [Candidatus Moranbacteria bacterium GW2011_GWF2_37_11]KKQ29301.1 MAG: Transcriptional regulator of heat shock protein [Candidatus Moranbacteria bacterium GW2011_GWD1_37_17]KKQ30826.1 MAG: Transcriptional regulator of heat shock protein [Candidatus Moranbacteria bacterium GW2011_GWE1_37_24]KKQ47971.1 MAG: Transcriptional reg
MENFKNMNKRQEKILAAVIEEYTKTAIPVGSKILVEKYLSEVSTATVRNDMAHLEKEGYLQQMHISSGRIPTDKGYRYFVESIMDDKELSKKEQQKLQTEMLKMQAKNNRLSRTTAKLLSVLSGNMAVSGIMDKNEFSDFGMSELLDQPEFRKMDEICRLAETLDYIDELFDKLSAEMKDGKTKIFIGKENPISEISNCSMIVSPYKSKTGERGILALIGPKRMRYAKNKSLIEYMKKILGGTMVIIIIINII